MSTDLTQIHNIGYRNYDGPRLGRAYARRSLFSQSLRGSYGLGRSGKSKILPMILFAVMCLPAAIMVAVAVATDLKSLPVPYTQYAIFLQAVIALFLAAQAPSPSPATCGSRRCRCTSRAPSSASTTSSPSTAPWPPPSSS